MPVRHQRAGVTEAAVLEAVWEREIGAGRPKRCVAASSFPTPPRKGTVAALAEARPQCCWPAITRGERLQPTEAQGRRPGQKPGKTQKLAAVEAAHVSSPLNSGMGLQP